MDPRSMATIAATLAQHSSLDAVLQAVVDGLCLDPNIALARIWLIRPGDICHECHHRETCPSHDRCLHLVASDGGPITVPTERWRGLNGRYRRFPINTKKIGQIVATGEAVNESRAGKHRSEFFDPEWAERERIVHFCGQPLIFAGEILGAMCVFSRAGISDDERDLMRLFANHAAASIVNARSYETIRSLKEQLEEENDALREELAGLQADSAIIGHSAAIRQVIEQVRFCAASDVTVLVQGESGTGKELVAQAIHAASRRNRKPLVRVNCASIPHHLFESEFFGHVKGAFTGAIKDRAGRFRLADAGTLFLDEIAEIPLELQSKLLRVLQEGTFEAVGDDRTHRVDVRVIAATNRDLTAEMRAGRFREDLFYRLSVFPVHVPPLRERREDIEDLARHFLAAAIRKYGAQKLHLTQADFERLRAYDWPGNVRELQNVMERATLTARAGRLGLDLPVPPGGTRAATPQAGSAMSRCTSYADLQQLEREMLRAVLTRCDGKVSGAGGAAQLLRVKPTTLAYRVKKLGLR